MRVFCACSGMHINYRHIRELRAHAWHVSVPRTCTTLDLHAHTTFFCRRIRAETKSWAACAWNLAAGMLCVCVCVCVCVNIYIHDISCIHAYICMWIHDHSIRQPRTHAYIHAYIHTPGAWSFHSTTADCYRHIHIYIHIYSRCMIFDNRWLLHAYIHAYIHTYSRCMILPFDNRWLLWYIMAL
jgi:hypothetical protein